MLLFYLGYLIASDYPLLDVGMNLLDRDENTKELIEMCNGFKINYVNDKTSQNTVINFKIELYDLPSNTGLYNLLGHLLMASLRKKIYDRAGKYRAFFVVSSMSFSFNVHSNYLSEIVNEFYNVLYNKKLDKGVIEREMQHIEEEMSSSRLQEDPLLVYLLQHFSYPDEKNLPRLGNKIYFDSYFKSYISKGNFLGEKNVQSFTQSKFTSMSEGYYEFLTYLLKTRLRKFPMSVLITTDLHKDQIIDMCKKFSQEQAHLIKRRELVYKNDFETSRAILIPDSKNTLSLLLKCSIPKNFNVISWFMDKLKERLHEKTLEKLTISPVVIEDQLYLCMLIDDYQGINFDLMLFSVFQGIQKSRFISFAEFEHLFKDSESTTSYQENVYRRKISAIFTLLILKTIEEIQFEVSFIQQHYQEKIHLIHEVLPEAVAFISAIHSIICEETFLMHRKDPKDYFKMLKEHLLDPSNCTLLIGERINDANEPSIPRGSKLCHEQLGLPDIFSNENNKKALSQFSMPQINELDVVISNCDYSSLTLVFKSGADFMDKVAFFLIRKFLETYQMETKDNFLSAQAKLVVKITFQNVLELTFMSKSDVFEERLPSFLASLKLYLLNIKNLKPIREETKKFKSKILLFENEKDEDINIYFKEFKSCLEVCKRLRMKCFYFGKEHKKLLENIQRDLRSPYFNFSSKDSFPYVKEKTPVEYSVSKGFNSKFLLLMQKDSYSFEELLKEKVINLIFYIKSSNFFLHEHVLGYHNKLEFSNCYDFSCMQMRIITPKSSEEIRKNIIEFLKLYESWIENLKDNEFEELKGFLKEILIEKNSSNGLRLGLFMSKWGFIEKYSELVLKIDNFFENDFSLNILQTWISESLRSDFQLPDNFYDE